MTLKELLIKIGFFVDKKEAENAFTELNSVLELAQKAANGVKTAFRELVGEAIDYGSQVHDTAQAIGVNAEALQELTYAAGQNGVSSEMLRATLQNVQKQAYSAATGNMEAAWSFGQLGISARDSSDKLKSADVRFAEIGEKLSRISDPTKRSALAMRLFGDAGVRMLPVFEKGAAGLEEMRQRARALGGVLSIEQVDAASAAGSALGNLSYAVNGLRRQIGADFFGEVREIAGSITEWTAANREWIKARVVQTIRDVKDAVVALLPGLRLAGAIFFTLVRLVGVLARALKGLPGVLWTVIAAVVAYNAGLLVTAASQRLAKTGAIDLAKHLVLLGKAFMVTGGKALVAGGQIALIGAAALIALAGLGLLIQDFAVFMDSDNPQDSVIGTFIESMRSLWRMAMQAPSESDFWLIKLLREAYLTLESLKESFIDFRDGDFLNAGAKLIYGAGRLLPIPGTSFISEAADMAFGLRSKILGQAPTMKALYPVRPPAVPVGGGTQVSQTNKVDVTVNVPAGSSPAEIGKATGDGVLGGLTSTLQAAASALGG